MTAGSDLAVRLLAMLASMSSRFAEKHSSSARRSLPAFWYSSTALSSSRRCSKYSAVSSINSGELCTSTAVYLNDCHAVFCLLSDPLQVVGLVTWQSGDCFAFGEMTCDEEALQVEAAEAMADQVSSNMLDVVRATARHVTFQTFSQAVCSLCSRTEPQNVKQVLDSVSSFYSTTHGFSLTCIVFCLLKYIFYMCNYLHAYILCTYIHDKRIFVYYCLFLFVLCSRGMP